MAVTRGPRAGQWRLVSTEINVSVRAPHEVLAVGESFNLRNIGIGGPFDARQSSARISDGPHKMSVAAEWRADHNADDITPIARTIKRLVAKHEGLGRPPICELRWAGESIRGQVSAFQLDWVHGVFDTPPYYKRGFVVALTVSEQLSRDLPSTGRFFPSTRQVRLGDGQTFESVAWDEYRDPDQGVVLRRINPHIPLSGESDGDVVRVLHRGHPDLRVDLAPVSPAFLETGDLRSTLQSFAVDRLRMRGPGLEALELELGL